MTSPDEAPAPDPGVGMLLPCAAVVVVAAAAAAAADDDDEEDEEESSPAKTASRLAPLIKRLTVRQKSVQRTIPLPAISKFAVSAATAAESWAIALGRKYSVAVPSVTAAASAEYVAVGGARALRTLSSFSLAMYPLSSESCCLKALDAAAKRRALLDSVMGLRSSPKRTVKCDVDPTTQIGSVGVL